MSKESDAIKAKYVDNEAYGPVFALDGLDHDVIIDDQGILRWVANPSVDFIHSLNNDSYSKETGVVIDHDRIFDLNKFWVRLRERGIGKNDSRVRKLYRDMGYSVYGYWEVFFWEMNNPIADQWKGDENGKVVSNKKKPTNAAVKARSKQNRR